MAKAEAFVDFILTELNKGEVSFERVFELMLTKFNLSRPTFAKYWKIASAKYSDTQKEALDNMAGIIAKSKEDALKMGLKSKIDRLLSLQKQENALNDELNAGIMIVHTFVDGVICQGERPMNSLERASIHKTIKEIRSEISKIEGDYAPTKTAITDTEGKDKDIPVLQPGPVLVAFPSNLIDDKD